MSLLWTRCATALVLGAGAGYLAAAAQETGRARIALTANKFEFSAPEIRARKGMPITFVLTAQDFVHGFSVPDFNARVDVVPGKQVELTFTPDKTGRFVFLCDNFCGDGHDRMTGFIVVGD